MADNPDRKHPSSKLLLPHLGRGRRPGLKDNIAHQTPEITIGDPLKLPEMEKPEAEAPLPSWSERELVGREDKVAGLKRILRTPRTPKSGEREL